MSCWSMLGKDIVSLIYKFLHQAFVQELNREYNANLVCVMDNGTVYFRQHRNKSCMFPLSPTWNSFGWNYRSTFSSKMIYNWKAKSYRAVGVLKDHYL